MEPLDPGREVQSIQIEIVEQLAGFVKASPCSSLPVYRSIVDEIYLLDGSSLAYRAFFALPQEMQTASGQMTNAVFGFTSMLLNLLKERHPAGAVVAFDRPEPTFRDRILADYKAGRPQNPRSTVLHRWS
jgi:5'-3' exonuclease (including N-terminal domain of PolI)